jgi:hypothetical protein
MFIYAGSEGRRICFFLLLSQKDEKKKNYQICNVSSLGESFRFRDVVVVIFISFLNKQRVSEMAVK